MRIAKGDFAMRFAQYCASALIVSSIGFEIVKRPGSFPAVARSPSKKVTDVILDYLDLRTFQDAALSNRQSVSRSRNRRCEKPLPSVSGKMRTQIVSRQ
jgi:hypothetical protein